MSDSEEKVKLTFPEKLHVLQAGGAVLCSKLQLRELLLTHFDSKRRVSCVSRNGDRCTILWEPYGPELYIAWLQKPKEVK